MNDENAHRPILRGKRDDGERKTDHGQPRDLHDLLLVLPFVGDQKGQDFPLCGYLEFLPRWGLQRSSVEGDQVVLGCVERERLDADRLPKTAELSLGTYGSTMSARVVRSVQVRSDRCQWIG